MHYLPQRLIVFATIALLGASVRAEAPSSVTLGGLAQFRWIAEAVENGRRHPLTREAAADLAAGFSIRRARLALRYQRAGIISALSLKLEDSPVQLLDAHITIPVRQDRFSVWIGQMKVPATYEVATASSALDFAERSRFSREVVDLSLCKNPSDFAPRFSGVKTYDRDLGVGAKIVLGRASGFIMIGNGLGANRYVGGAERKGEVYTNDIGAHFYAARLRVTPLQRSGVTLILGGHGACNHHPNILLDDERTVTSIKRRSYSGDVQIRIAERLRLVGLYGAALVLDDNDGDGRDDYRVRGWELRTIAHMRPGRFTCALRWEGFAEEWHAQGNEDVHTSWAAGLTLMPRSDLRVQGEYKWKRLESDSDPDLSDNIVTLMCQVQF